MNIQKTAFECKRDGLSIRGTVFRNESAEKQHAVILSHGFMSSQKETMPYAEKFAELGYSCFNFDFCGGCIKGTSDGKSEDMTVMTEMSDLSAVIDYVKTRSDVVSDKITLFGCSQGGFVSGMVAAKRKEDIERLVLFYPALCIPDDARKGQMLGFRFDPNNMPEILSKFPMKIGRGYAECVLNIDSVKEIQGYDGKVLIVHGTNDKVVNPSYAEKAYEAFGKENCDLIYISGAGHGFKGKAMKVAADITKEFLLDKREIINVDVKLTGHKLTRKGRYTKLVLPFEGTASSKWLYGTIEDGANDTQERKGYKPICFKADYVISGKDYLNAPCKVHVVNQNDGTGWKPTVETDSEALSFLNSADCDAVLEDRKGGPIVRIFCQVPKNK